MENKQTAMQQLLNQMREERNKLPIPIEWGRAYQAIEMMIENTYIPLEREQIVNTFKDAQVFQIMEHETRGEQYYNENYGK